MQPHDVAAALRGLPERAGAPFAKLARFNHGAVFVGRFAGRAPWERHRHGDELVHVLAGEVDVTVLTPRGPVAMTLGPGCVLVVPRGLWHRQQARGTVTLLSATPTPTDVSFAEDPRSDGRSARTRGKPARPRRRRAAGGRRTA